MIEFEKPNITKIDENKDYGVFVVEPLERKKKNQHTMCTGFSFYINDGRDSNPRPTDS